MECCRGGVGYAIAYDYWGKGIATQALSMAVAAIFSHFQEIKRIDAFTTNTNSPSQMEEKNKEGCITLRPFELTDLSDVMAGVADDRVAQRCWWAAFQSGEDALSFLKSSLTAHPWARAICLSGRPIGQMTFLQGSDIERCRGEIGYALAYEHWGKGIATEALKMAVSAIFCEFPEIQRIDAVVIDWNVGSQRVLEKVGFVKEGLLRKYCVKNGETVDIVVV
ncbi:putative N-acetyltransferase [Nymphaea thermarum]|nr:putative N-acetyltransferase [Nymphaea thermarum]